MILGLIPARGGSKGVPNKNIKIIYGKPLIVWTIERALQSELLDKVIVSTDSDEIAWIARSAGAEVLRRPASLATDTASTQDVMAHALHHYSADILVLLQPTSPCRKEGLIDECIQEFQSGGYDSLATGFLCDYKEYGTNTLPRQQIQGFFYDDGNVYVIKAENILAGDRYGKKIGRKLISRYENAEIDDAYDFWLLEQILKKQCEQGIDFGKEECIMDEFKGVRIKNEKVRKKIDNRQLLHYEFTDVEKTLATVHGEKFTEYRKMWDDATELKLVPEKPLYIILETNSYCNMKCKMCTRNFFSNDERIDISMDIIDRIAEQCKECEIPSVFIGASAECLINPDIKKILKKIKDIGCLDCFLITNGYCLTEEMTDFLIDIQFERIYVSLDAAYKDTYKEIRGCDLDVVEKNLNYLLKRREERGSILPLVRVSFVMQDANKDEIEVFYDKWRDKVDIIDYQCLIDYSELDVLKEEEELPDIDFQCVNPFRQLIIDYKGDIFPCASDYDQHMKIGNIQDMTLKEAWNSQRMTDLRQSMLDKKLCKICRNCVAHNSIQ